LSIYRNFFSLGNESLDNIIKSVNREHHYTPAIIDAFFLDRIDWHGLIWHYEDIVQMAVDACTKTAEVDVIQKDNPYMDDSIFEKRKQELK